VSGKGDKKPRHRPRAKKPEADAEVPRAEGPERSCVACRGPAPRDELIRLARSPDGVAVVDLKGSLPGRGAWVHPTTACVTAVEADPRLLHRAFDAPTATEGLLASSREVVHRALLDGLSLAAAGGAVIGGHDAIENAARLGQLVALILASDAAERTVKDVIAAGPELPVTRLTLDRDSLGRRVGQAPRAALGVTRDRAAAHLVRQLHRLRGLG
jgi:uncharacterized protein